MTIMEVTMDNGILFVISGPSASGKGTVVKSLLSMFDDVGLSVSATTREPREGEVDGQSYFFITKEEFESRIARGEILEHTVYNNQYYGTPYTGVKNALDSGRDIILEIEVDGACQVKKKFGDNAVTIMLTPPDFATLEARLRGRNSEKSEETIKWRLSRAKEEIKLLPEYDYWVVNEDGQVDACAILIHKIIEAERVKRKGVKTEEEKALVDLANSRKTNINTDEIIKKFI
jgi:guanylate kinase